MNIQQAYEAAVLEINALRDEITEKFQGEITPQAAMEMAEKQWLYGNLFALKHKKRIGTNETKGKKDGKSNRNDLPEL